MSTFILFFVAFYPQILLESHKFKHCWVSCRISKICGGQIATISSLGKEVIDAFNIYIGASTDTWYDSFDDLAADFACTGLESYFTPIGAWIGAACRQSCEDCCKKELEPYGGYYAEKIIEP